MNIDGQDVKLKFVSSVSAPKGEVRKGQRTTSKYVASGITVTINSIVRKAPLKEGEEVTDYTATITVIKGSRKQTVQAIGFCGC